MSSAILFVLRDAAHVPYLLFGRGRVAERIIDPQDAVLRLVQLNETGS
jgi:hypothetical protein